MNLVESRYPCEPPAMMSSVVLRGRHEYTTSVANGNTRLHEIQSAGDQEALKLRPEHLSFACCCPGHFSRERSALGECLPGGRLRFVASRLPIRRQLFCGSTVERHQLDQLAFKIFSERDIRGFQVLLQLVGELPRLRKAFDGCSDRGFDDRLRVGKRINASRMPLLVEVSF